MKLISLALALATASSIALSPTHSAQSGSPSVPSIAREWVLFLADQHVNHVETLYSMRPGVDAQPIQLSHDSHGKVIRSQLMPDGRRVIYLAREQPSSASNDVYIIPVDGSAPGRRLNDVGANVAEFGLSPRGDFLIYSTDSSLFRVNLAGDDTPTLLLQSTGVPLVSELRVSPDGLRVLYVGEESYGSHLYSVALEGTASPMRLSPDYPQNLRPEILSLDISPDSQRVIFKTITAVGYHEIIYLYALYSAAIDQPGAFEFYSEVETYSTDYDMSADSSRLVYKIGNAVWNASIDGQGAHIRLDGAGENILYDVHLLKDGTMIYQGWVSGDFILRRTAIDNPMPVDLSLPGGFIRDVLLTTDESRAVFVGKVDHGSPYELFSVPVDGSTLPIRLNSPLPPGGSVERCSISADGRYVIGLESFNDAYDLRFVPIDGSLPSTAITGPIFGGVREFMLTRSGAFAFYSHNDNGIGNYDAYLAPAVGGQAPQLLTPDSTISTLPVGLHTWKALGRIEDIASPSGNAGTRVE